jgi:hypothetical protein
MLQIFWTAYLAYIVVLLSVLGSFLMHTLRRRWPAQPRLAPASPPHPRRLEPSS